MAKKQQTYFDFGQLLRGFRERADLQQQELAAELGVNRNVIGNWEAGRFRPRSRDTVLRLAEILGLSRAETDQLLVAADYPEEYHTTKSELPPATHLEQLTVDRLRVGNLEGIAPTPPPAPLRTRIPEPRTKNLVGRSDELDWLCQRLQAGDVAALAGVRGIGGIGKTELAIAAARTLENHFEGRVIWLDGGPNNIFAIQTRLAAALGIQLSSDDLPVRADSLDLALRQQPPTLVVLDDLRQRHLAELRFLPLPRPPCAVLLTSRRYDLGLPQEAIKILKVLDEAPARTLLANLLPAEWLTAEPEALAGSLKLLDNIPLALTLAASRALEIAKRQDEPSRTQPLATLLAELQARRLQVLDQGEDPNRPDLSVVITFNASYDDLDEANQARLRRLGVFAHSEFSLAALQAVWGDDERAARQALRTLVNAGLLEETRPDVWWMHDLLREYAADRLSDDPAEEQAARLVHAAFWRDYLSRTTLRGVEDWQNLESQRPEIEQAAHWFLADWQRQPVLASSLALWIAQKFLNYSFPQLELLLRVSLNTFQKILQTTTTEEETQEGQRGVAVTQSSLAALLRTRGQYDEAERLYRESLAVKEKLGDSRSVAVTQSSLADLLRTRGQYDEAERLYRESLAVKEKLGDNREVAVTQSSLATLLSNRGQYDEAERLYHESLAVFEKLGDSREVAVTQSSLAALLRTRGQYDEAERLFRESLAVKEKLGDSRAVAVTQSSLADLLRTRGQYDEAERLFRESLAVFEKLGDSREVAVTQSSLAALLSNRGQYDEAVRLYWESLAVFEKLGDSREVAVTQSSLAALLSNRGQYDEAERLYRESLTVKEKLGDSRSVAVTQSSLANLLRTRGQYDEAERLFRESLTVFEKLGDSREVALTQSNLADLLGTRGQYDEAERLYRESLAVFEKLGDSREVAVTQSSLAALLRTRGQYDEAERLFRESLAVKEKLGDSREVAVTQSSLAALLRTRGQYDEAERLYMAGLAITQAIRDPQGVAVFLMGLGQLALARGQREQALPLLQEARQGFAALRLAHWVSQVDELLARAQARGLTLADLLALIKAAGQGDQQAWEICGQLAQSADTTEAALGRGLQRLLTGEAPETALAVLPADLRAQILALW